eukprot:Hpha_TRINITY_DN16773_c1_g1::TRINITY_DN16773_c1_g1_i1::g.78263::m.78263
MSFRRLQRAIRNSATVEPMVRPSSSGSNSYTPSTPLSSGNLTLNLVGKTGGPEEVERTECVKTAEEETTEDEVDEGVTGGGEDDAPHPIFAPCYYAPASYSSPPVVLPAQSKKYRN